MMPALAAQELSDRYNNSLAVPDYPAYLERWRAESAALRAQARYHADLPYGTRPRDRIDLFAPASGDAPWPLLIFLHGGYWQYLCKEDWSCVAAPFTECGMAVAIVGYSLCPEVGVAEIVGEIRAACRMLYLEADHYGLERKAFHVAGHSAGGHLTAMMLATNWPSLDAGLPTRMFQSGIAISGVFDLEPLTVTHLNAALRLTPEEALAVSPILQHNSAGTPLLVAVGAAESSEFLRQSRDFCAAWPQARYLEVPGLNHFSAIDAFHDPASPLFAAAWAHMHRGRSA